MYRFRRASRIIAAVIAISFLMVSCGDSKDTQCQKFVLITRKVVNETQTITNGGKNTDSAALIKIADLLDKATKELELLELKDEKLKGFKTGFISWYRNNSKATRSLVDARKNKNLTALDESVKTLQKSYKLENDLVNGINTYCTIKK